MMKSAAILAATKSVAHKNIIEQSTIGIIISIILTIIVMPHPFIQAEGRPSALGTLLRRTFRSGSRQNFVRPQEQLQDPQFPCPKCSKTLTVPVSQAGKKGRCRHCYSPIRNAAPALDRPAVDLSQSLDSIARPEDYPLCGHRASTIDYLPRGVLAAMPLLALVAIGIVLLSLLPKGDVGTGIIAAAHGSTPIEVLGSPAIEAEELVSEFLTTDDWTESVVFVHDGLNVASEVAALSEHLPEGGFSTTSKLNEDGTSTVRVNFQDGSLTHFQVAHIDGEDLIIWDANPNGMPNELGSRMAGLPESEPN